MKFIVSSNLKDRGALVMGRGGEGGEGKVGGGEGEKEGGCGG